MDVDPNERIEATWCLDAETGEWCLLDRITNKVIIRQKERPHA